MGLFDPISTAITGVNVSQTWLDTISENIANMNDVTSPSQGAYQTRFWWRPPSRARWKAPGPAPRPRRAWAVAPRWPGSRWGAPTGCWSTTRPTRLAGKQGMVRSANVNLGDQMSDMMMAQNGYEANLATVSQAEQAYQAALGMHI